nr:neurotensin [Gallus gallus]prf//1922374A neurotensin [Alligator mississippiensis]
ELHVNKARRPYIL